MGTANLIGQPGCTNKLLSKNFYTPRRFCCGEAAAKPPFKCPDFRAGGAKIGANRITKHMLVQNF